MNLSRQGHGATGRLADQEKNTAPWQEFTKGGERLTGARRDITQLRWVRAWVADDPVATWHEDLDAELSSINGREVFPVAGAYSARELDRVFAWSSVLPTQYQRDLAVGAIALAFGAGLSPADMRKVHSRHVVATNSGVRVVVDGQTLPVRGEVSAALLSVVDHGVLPLPHRPLRDVEPDYQLGRISARRLQETWGR